MIAKPGIPPNELISQLLIVFKSKKLLLKHFKAVIVETFHQVGFRGRPSTTDQVHSIADITEEH